MNWDSKVGGMGRVLGTVLGAEAPFFSHGVSFQLLTYTTCLSTKSQMMTKESNIENTHFDEGKLRHPKCLVE